MWYIKLKVWGSHNWYGKATRHMVGNQFEDFESQECGEVNIPIAGFKTRQAVIDYLVNNCGYYQRLSWVSNLEAWKPAFIEVWDMFIANEDRELGEDVRWEKKFSHIIQFITTQELEMELNQPWGRLKLNNYDVVGGRIGRKKE